jgi:tetratricopeptide (TPR) repeat protein
MRGKTPASNQWSVRPREIILLTTLFVGVSSAQTQSAAAEAVARNNEAIQLASQGREGEAEKQYRAALDACDDDLNRARIANNLAELYRREDRYRDAEIMYRSALQWRLKNLPAASVEVAYSLNNLAEIYRVEGRDWEARSLMEQAARSLQEFHSDAFGLPVVLSNYAVMLCRFGKFDQAEELLRAALITYDQRRATPSRQYGVTLVKLGQVLETKNDLEAAVPLYDQAIGIFENLGAPARMELASALANRGELYERLDRPEEARQTEERALELLHPAGDALIRSQILRNLGNIMAGAGKPADSMPYFEQSLVIQEKTLGAEHPATASLLLDYASATQRAGNKSLSRKLRKRAQDLLARLSSRSLSQMTVSLRDLRESK